MNTTALLLPVLTAFLVPALSSPWLASLLRRRGVVDRPGERRSHARITPRGGGLGLGLGIVLGLLLMRFSGSVPATEFWVVLLLVLSLSGLGAMDDFLELGVGVRMLGQALIAAALLLWSGWVDELRLGATLVVSMPWLFTALAWVAILWLINLHNFMDGSDGLASMQAVWTGAAYAMLFWFEGHGVPALVALLLTAASAGFLIWNRPVARIFLGDSGSLLIGGLVAWLALQALLATSISLMLCILVSSLFVVDATLTLLARAARGERWYTPHRTHAYQTLLRLGWSHAQVLWAYLGVNLLVVLPATLAAQRWPSLDFVLGLGVVGLLAAGWWSIQSAANGER
ncbi:hypothetical protein [Wenzhouxiangella marina]|uniref:Uncharacterized protein n=1 Tax=Wenzhouxiangella marina TaxID=1579979 RepID=A0A0K0XVI8_9GAMM|nr:hypothetical protein [Wenzhouxiangella marina]AKS41704.1 hypothetical protein WM2015_1332 [Wenzhouxiangella marina]MBB6086534.1 Fuc2NAc and GlcNAc transferase [Wenzhouxiangella marina]